MGKLGPMRSVVVLTALMLLAAACGDDGGETTSGDTSADVTTTTVADEAEASFADGCTEDTSWVDPLDMDQDRSLARCEPNTPAPKPLPERATMIVASAALTSEHNGPLRYAFENGEFEKENLEVELRQLGASDSYPALANGEIDAVWGGPDAGFHNQIIAGANFKWVTGNYYPAEDSQTGLWANKSCGAWDGEQPSAAALKGKSIGSVVGGGSVIIYPIGEAVRGAGGSLADIELKQLPGGADFIKALKDCAVEAAWVLDPFWLELQEDPDMVFLQGQPPKEPLGGLLVGPNVLDDNPAKGEAFVRALIRTINTHFPTDYHENEAFMDEIAALLGQEKATLLRTPSMQFDWEIRSQTSERLQEYYTQTGAQQGVRLAESRTTDRSFYEAAIGKAPSRIS